jgi:hypothetical protein
MYQYQIAARSSSGAGESVVTNPIAPGVLPSAPRSVAWTVIDGVAGSVLITWTAPSDSGGHPVDRFEVSTRRWDNGEVIDEATAEPTATSLLLTDLPLDVEMFFLVRAVNRTGPGPYADVDRALVMSSAGPSPSRLDYVSSSLQFGSLKINVTPEQDEALADAISEAAGVPAESLGKLESVPVFPGQASFFMPFKQSTSFTAADSLRLEIGQLVVDTQGGAGTAVMALSETVRLEGAARVFLSSVGVEIGISDIRLVAESLPGDSATALAAERGLGPIKTSFEVEVKDISDISGPGFEYSLAVSGIVLVSLGTVQLPAGAEVAYTVGVIGGPANDHLGDTVVTFAVADSWLAGVIADMHTTAVVKTEDGGQQFIKAAACERGAAVAVCTAVFDDDSGGFSAFTLAARAEWPGIASTVNAPDDPPAPASTPSPAASPTNTPTATPVPLPTAPVGGGEAQGGGGSSAWLLVGVPLAIGALAAGGVAMIIWRRRPATAMPAAWLRHAWPSRRKSVDASSDLAKPAG